MPQKALGIARIPVSSRTLEPAQHTNIYLIGDHNEAILVDGGFVDTHAGLEEISSVLQEWNNPQLRAVLVTHGHPDHVHGLQALADRFSVSVYAHPNEVPGIQRFNPGLTVEALQGGDRWTVAGNDLVVIATPGHTSGHLSFWLPSAGVLLCGDTMAGEGTVWVGPPDGNMAQYLATLRRIQQLAPSRVGPGHGPWIEQPADAVSQLIEHRLMRERQIISLLETGPQTVQDLARKVYEGQIPDRIMPFAEKTVMAHLEKLLWEGVVKAETTTGGNAGPLYRIG